MSNIQKVCTSRVMPSMPDPAFEQRVGAVRRFSRFYTREIGLLQASWLDSSYSLTQARVLYELSRRKACTASDLASELGLDHGYLSRILRGFADRGLITRQRSKDDGRQSVISLTAKGRKAFAPLDARSQREAGALIAKLGAEDQSRVVDAMAAIEALIGRKENEARTYLLRPHRAGDMGWVVERHGLLYCAEYGWDSRIEGLTAEIVATFLKNFDPARERCWIAEIGGEPVGSVFLVKESDEVARLRLLIVDPKARGLGIGRRLVDECIAFARQAGYSKITLWTHGVLKAARAIYQQAGFTLAAEWVHDEFGKPEPAESWELKL